MKKFLIILFLAVAFVTILITLMYFRFSSRAATTVQNDIFIFNMPGKIKSYDSTSKNFYLSGYKFGYMDVFNGVSVEDFSDEIKEQIVHKGYSGIYICIARDGAFSPSVSQKQSTAYYEGGSDGQKYANDIINKAINEHFNELDIVDRFARAKEKLGKGEF